MGCVIDNTTVSWTDKKRYLWLLGLVVPLPEDSLTPLSLSKTPFRVAR